MARPSPRTLGKTVDPITGEEVFFKMFGTQQLKFIDPAKPALGVRQVDVKPTLRIGWFDYGTPTVRNTAYPDLTITKGVGTTTPAPFNGNGNGKKCTKCDSDKCVECDAWDVPCELGHMFAGTCTPPPVDYTKNGCECENCKNGTGECSDKCGKCNAWDLGCEATCGLTPPPNTWLWVKIILVLVGIGILLWLLRPLFGIAKNITET